ncbi:MAG TPA: FtsX-like permease family protein, partial [Candidatus Limnocylindria bacterium]
TGTQVPVLRTGLLELLDDFRAQRAASEAVLSIAAIGPLTLAAGAVGMVGVLLVSRRRGALALARSRGATGLLLLGAQLWEALLLAGSAALLGLAAAVAFVPGRASPLSAVLALGVGLTAVAALVASTWPVARRPLGELAAEQPLTVRTSPRRLVGEATVVFVALGGIWLLRQRGLTIGEGEATRFDPLLAATPALAGLAVGIVAMRLYPLPIRALGWLAARRRDLVPVLGLRSVGRHPSAANLPLLVLMLTAAFGAFASVVTTTVDRAQVTASWENLGADYLVARRLGTGPITAAVDPSVVPGVEAVAAGYRDDSADFRSEPEQRASLLLYALEPARYRDVVAGSPVDPAWPGPMLGPARTDGLGTPANPIPAIVSRRLPPGSKPIQPGGTFQVAVAGQVMTFVDVEERDAFPGLPGEGIFVIAPFDQLQAAYTSTTLQPNLLLVRGPAAIGDELSRTVTGQLSALGVTSRHAAYDALRGQPLVAVVSTGFLAALLAAAVYLALAVLASLTLSAARRTRDLAFLRTLGVSSMQSVALTLMEHAPPVLLALVPGVALGVGVAYLLGPSLGLASFAGAAGGIGLSVDWASVALLAAGLLGVVGLAVGISSWAARRAGTMDALRIGDD